MLEAEKSYQIGLESDDLDLEIKDLRLAKLALQTASI